MTNNRPSFVVARHPSRWRWLTAGLVLALVGVALWVTDHYARRSAVAGFDQLVAEREVLAGELAEARERIVQLEQENAVLQRAEQVANNAAASLRESLDERQTQIAQLGSDLDFYQRLLGTGGEQQGLAVHSLDLYPTNSAQVFRFELTLVQNLRKATVVEGRVTLRILGTREDEAIALGDDAIALSDDAEGLEFAFKYFQQLEGRITLPRGFKADSVRVRLLPSQGDAIIAEYDWAPLPLPAA